MPSYEDRGVSPVKTDIETALSGTSKGLFPGAFCKIVEDVLGNDDEYCSVIHADGAGSKSALAYIQYRETGDPRVFRDIACDALAMNLDDLVCVGATGPFIVSNAIGRNANLVPAEVLREIIEGYEAVAEMLARHDIQLTNCGGETADIGDVVRTVIVDATVATRMRRTDIIDASKVRPGHCIVGLASFGQAIYESAYNSGISTNGFTAARHEVLAPYYKVKFPETFDPAIAPLAYAGTLRLDDEIPQTKTTVAAALLAPTRIYAPVMRKVLGEYRSRISAIFHNTGGGQTKCLKFGQNVRYVKDKLLPLPAIFQLIRRNSSLGLREMARVFNLGHRMEIVCDPDAADGIIAISRGMGVDAKVVGHVEAAVGMPTLQLTIEGEALEFP